MTEEELVRRRRDKLKRLHRLYKAQFHRFYDILKTKHRKFIKAQQKLDRSTDINSQMSSPKDSTNNANKEEGSKDGSSKQKRDVLLKHYHHIKHAKIKPTLKEMQKGPYKEKKKKICAAEHCKAKTMLLTDYCFNRK